MVIDINEWVYRKAIRYRTIVDNSPQYDLWDQPQELCSVLSQASINRIEEEVYYLDVEEIWGPDGRKRFKDHKQPQVRLHPAEVIKLKA